MPTKTTRAKSNRTRSKHAGSKQATSHSPTKSPRSRRAIAPDEFLRYQLVSDPQISPDGNRILCSKQHVGEKNRVMTNLWMVDVDSRNTRQFTAGEKDRHGRFSPDGETIAFIAERDDSRPQIYTMSSSGGEAVALTKFPEGSIGNFRWSPDGSMLAVKFRETDPEWTAEAKKRREETGGSEPARVIDQMYYRLDGDGYFNAQRYHLYIVDVTNGEHRLLYHHDTLGWFDYDFSPDSTELIVSTNTTREPFLNFWNWELIRVAVQTGKTHKLEGLPEGRKAAVAWSPEGRHIAFSAREGREHWGVRNTHLFVCEPDGNNLVNLTQHTDYCLSAITLSDTSEAAFEEHLLWSPDGSRLFLNFGWRGEQHVASISPSGGDVTFHTQGREVISLGNISDDGTRLALTVASAVQLAEVAVGEFHGKRPSAGNSNTSKTKSSKKKSSKQASLKRRAITAFNRPLLDELTLSEPEPQSIESADGTRVPLWVMKPPGFRRGEKYPAILTIHGGPHTQYGETFFHEFQAFAAAGYVVVFSNPRGSKGYGEEYCAAIRGNWGDADWQDIQAVIEFMKQQPYVDANRMGVCGGSYGGYMTNWVISHTTDFAAAVTDRCVANLVSMVGSSDLPLVPGEYWDGNSWDNTENLWHQSPLQYFGNVETPTLVIHSEGDLRCNVEQSEQVFTALKLRGVPARLVRYPASTSHGMSRNGPPDLRLHRLGQYLEWWHRYLQE